MHEWNWTCHARRGNRIQTKQVNTGRLTAGRTLLPLAIVALPLILLISSLRTFKELAEQRTVYLRHRVALLAARLERMPPEEKAWETLSEEEPNLVSLQIISPGGVADSVSLAALWNGGELFRTSFEDLPEGDVFRAYVPFHSVEGLRIARLDLSASAADFLVVHAWHNVIVASLAGLALVTLSIYAVWAMRRTARLRVRQLEMEHLAHIGKMSAMLAHEIRNPLGTIKGYVQLAGERASEETRTLLAPVLSEAERLESLVNGLLAYGRPPNPNLSPVDWTDVAAAVEQHSRHLVGERPLKILVTEGSIRFRTDAALLTQALLNLVRNATEAVPTNEAGEVRVEAGTSEKGDVVIKVNDTGPGIPAGVRSRLFEPFVTTKTFGTGLGLAITRKLVRSLGGELEIASGPRGGTTAAIRLPRSQR